MGCGSSLDASFLSAGVCVEEYVGHLQVRREINIRASVDGYGYGTYALF